MKKIISVLMVLTLVSVMAFAQKSDKKNPEKWREKVRAEQVAFITSELDLTEAEAQAFWPVYNDVQKQRREAFQVSADAFKALQEGLEGKDAATLLDKYLSAKAQCEKVEADALARYKKVLPIEKVARLVVAEEKYRHMQIGKLGGNKKHQPQPGSEAPGGRRPHAPGHSEEPIPTPMPVPNPVVEK